MLDKRLNDKGKNWRHVLKSLKVLDYCLHEGSELVVTWARKNVYIIKTLREFQYVDDDSRDVGQNGEINRSSCGDRTDPNTVRTSARELTSLIMDEERLRMERSDRKTWKSRVTGITEFGPPEGSHEPQRQRPQRRRQDDEEDAEYRLAIEASKYEAEEEKRRRATDAPPTQDDDLAKAIRLSKEEEELRRKELEESNASKLFDDTSSQPQQQQPQFTGYNQGYQQQPQVDFFGNPINQQQQPQSTGYLNNAYSQPTGFQAQQTGFPNSFQPQQTGFDQNQFQQQPQYMQQQNTVQPQQTAFDTMNNPYGQQQGAFANQFQQQPQNTSAQPAASNPWGNNQQQQQLPESIKPMPTGSNNPFATNRPQLQQQQSSPPTLSNLAEQRTATQSNQQMSFNPIANYPIQQQQQQQPQQQQPQQSLQQQKPMNPQHERLNALLASGEGMDTFGNTGELRIPAQHTAPGTFVNSAGQNLNKLHSNQTGNNPFLNQQFTGQPNMQGSFNAPSQLPAQTGPAGMYGQPNNNPFGPKQNVQQQGHGGSLIDL